MWNQQKKKTDLKEFAATVFVRIGEEDRRKADGVLLQQKFEEANKKEENKTDAKTNCPFLKNPPQKKLSKQKLRKTDKEKVIFICDYCAKDFSYASLLKRHLTVHTGQKDVHCNLCDFSTACQGKLTVHIRSRHLKERPFKCPEPNCEADFTRTGHLTRHEFIHNNKKDKRFSCSACPFKTNEKRNLTRHVQNIHSDSRPFKCPHKNCEYSAKQKSELNRHSNIHSDKKNQVCPHPNCGYKTKWPRYFKIHMKTHLDGEKRFKCGFCSYSSHHHGDLVLHVRRHTGETPFACQLCSYKSKVQSSLIRHVKIHCKTGGENRQE